MKNVLIVGATSGIAKALAYVMAADGCNLLLAGRDLAELQRTCQDLQIRYPIRAEALRFEALRYEQHAPFFAAAAAHFGHLDGLVLAYGYLGDQPAGQRDFAEARTIIETNFLSAVSLLTLAAEYFEQRQQGFLCVLASVAGDRGRQSNYLYGSAKGALSLYLQGLRNRLSRSGVTVLTVKPGFVDTKMTYGQPGMFLVAQPDQVARSMYRAIGKRQDVLYTPWFWRYIMLIIKLIPEGVFKKLRL